MTMSTNFLYRNFFTFVMFQTLFCSFHSFPSGDLYASSPAGNFIGYGGKSWSGKFFVSFSGIKFARAPVGQLRFRDPVPYVYDPDQIVNATKEGPDCMQNDPYTFNVTGEEDCLYLNIYSPNVTGKAPVILYIFGGGFWSGTSSRKTYAPEYFLDENVVFATANYRVGALGYASTENYILPGNLGQTDQIEALKWFRKNIKFFGGDPDNINIMGESSGGESVSLLMHSPVAQHLIKRGIAQSDSPLSPLGISHDHRVRNKTLELARLLGCPTDSYSWQLFYCFQGMSGRHILSKVNYLRSSVYDLSPFRPVKDPAGYRTIDAPLLTGFTNTEAAYFSITLWAELLGTTTKTLMLAIKSHFVQFLIELLTVNPHSPPKWIQPLARAMEDFYWAGKNETSNGTVLSILQAISDLILTYPVYEQAQLSKGPLYTYFFNYTSPFDIGASLGYGTTHTDELKYFFPNDAYRIRNMGSPSDREQSIKLVKMWTDFASGRNPTPNLDWTETSSRGGYLLISNSGLSLVDVKSERTEMTRRLKFWANLLKDEIGQNRRAPIFQEIYDKILIGLKHSFKLCLKR